MAKYTAKSLEQIASEVVRKFQTTENVGLRKSRTEVAKEATNTTLSELLNSDSSDERIVKFQKMSDEVKLLDSVLSSQPNYSGIKSTKLYKKYNEFLTESEFSKAMTRTSVGAGAEFLPLDFSNQLIEKVQLALKVAAQFAEIKMPSDPFKIPQKSAFTKTVIGTEATTPAETTMGTNNVQLATVELVNYVNLSYQLDEDAVIAMLPELNKDVANSIARAIENATINGTAVPMSSYDLTTIDGTAFAANSPENAWGGFRDYSIRYDGSVTPLRLDIGDTTYGTNGDKLSALIAGTNQYRGTNSDWIFIVSTQGEHFLRTLKTAAGAPLMQPIYSAGNIATINNAAVDSIYGIPVIVSEFMRNDLNAYGFADHTSGYSAGGNFTAITLVRKDAFTYGTRRDIMVETFRDVTARVTKLVASTRRGFVPRYKLGDPFCRTGINLKVA